MQKPNNAQPSKTVGSNSKPRRSDIDWLRVIAFGMLIFYHAANMFKTNELPDMTNSETSAYLAYFSAFSHLFRLDLLFFVSGVGVYFSLKRRTPSEFIKERRNRLLIPFVFGIIVVIPPLVYFEKLFANKINGNILEFTMSLFTSGFYPQGNLAWFQYWFIAYLFLYCLLFLPAIKYFRSEKGSITLSKTTSWLAHKYNFYWVCLPIIFLELILRPFFPGERSIINDWASFFIWYVLFFMGFVLGSDTKILDKFMHIRLKLLTTAIAFTALLFYGFYDGDEFKFLLNNNPTLTNIPSYLLHAILRGIIPWVWVLTCVGYTAKYLNHSNKLLVYLNRALYPLFCLHFTVLVMLAYYILPLELSVTAKFSLITAATFAISFLIYEFLICKVRWLQPLFGLASPKNKL